MLEYFVVQVHRHYPPQSINTDSLYWCADPTGLSVKTISAGRRGNIHTFYRRGKTIWPAIIDRINSYRILLRGVVYCYIHDGTVDDKYTMY